MYLNRSSEYTLIAIDEIRKLTKGLTSVIQNIGLCEAIENTARVTMEVNPAKISCAFEGFKEHSVNDKFKLNVYRILQEQMNNILKYAKATKVAISFSQNKKNITLTISDNGVGFDGTADFVSQPGQGCVLTVTFPYKNLQMQLL